MAGGAQNPAQQPQGGRVAPSKSGFDDESGVDDDFIVMAIGGVVVFFTILILAIDVHNTFLWWPLVGWIAGFLASRVMRGGGYGLVGDIVVGIIGGPLRRMVSRPWGLVPLA